MSQIPKKDEPGIQEIEDWHHFLQEVGRQTIDFISMMPYPIVMKNGDEVRIGLQAVLYAQAQWTDSPLVTRLRWVFEGSVVLNETVDLKGLFKKGAMARSYGVWTKELEYQIINSAPKARLLIMNIQDVF
jgi:hypothetical protein